MTDNSVSQERAERSFPRRRLLRGATLVTGAALSGFVSPYSMEAAGTNRVSFSSLLAQLDMATPESIDDYVPVALSAAEMNTLKAVINRIIPSDELGPGAVEAGAHVFIDQALAGNSAMMLPFFQGGFTVLDAAAGSGGFAGLDAAKQDELLTQAEAGTLADLPDGFFGLIVYNTRTGMFSDPVHGGNKNFVGWDLMQFPGIKLVWTAADQQIDAVVKPEHVSVAQFQGE
jgi:hypothetical protein